MRKASPSDLHCALGTERSFTDPVNNWVMISGVELNRDLARMMEGGRFPISCLPDFLHETVHHMCFNSPVGIALSVLRLRSRRYAALRAAGEGPDRLGALSEAVVRYDTAIALMRPLAEGLALFGEFDAIPGGSRVISYVMTLAGVNFLKDFPEGENIDESVLRLLAGLRPSDLFSERKLNLLLQPMGAMSGGYLAGYLLTKGLWHKLFRTTGAEKLTDTDFYLQYLRAFFYEDMAFVSVLLDPETRYNPWVMGENDSIQSIALYFQKRYRALNDATSKAAVEQVENAILQGGNNYLDRIQIANDQAQAQRGKELLEHALAEIYDPQRPASNLEKNLQVMEMAVLQRRQFLCIGSFTASVRVNEHGRVLAGEHMSGGTALPLLSMPGLPHVQPQQGEGTLEFFLKPGLGGYSFLTATLGEQLVAVGSRSNNFTDTEHDEVVKWHSALKSSVAQRHDTESLVEKALDDPEIAVPRQHYRNEVLRVAEEFYHSNAFAWLPYGVYEQMLPLIKENGLYEIFDGNIDLLGRIARFTLANSFSVNREVIHDILGEYDIELDELLDRVRRCGHEAANLWLEEIKQSGLLLSYI